MTIAEESLTYLGDGETFAEKIQKNLVGHAAPYTSPFGKKQVLYCDYIASGRSLAFVEEYMRNEVLPTYANTHTTTTVTAKQTTMFRQEARDIVRGAVNAYDDEDAVIFVGSGCTGAIHKLIGSLNLQRHETRPLVFVGGQEHHSNLLPWREVGCEMVTIAETAAGQVNVENLERRLQDARKAHKNRPIIGLFTVASNVSGILNDDLTITALLHKYDALAFWDYAAAAPYVNIDMNPMIEGDESAGRLVAKDAIYFSMHKFVGGPQTPGVLVAKKHIFSNPSPQGAGGGTVLYVTEKEHRYLQSIEEREEGGTPAIVESIRAGIVMLLKENIGAEYIMSKEEQMMNKAIDRLQKMPNLVILGNAYAPRLPILSFMIKAPSVCGVGYLHHNFICFLLNDLFGIQSRGGCACAGPYVQRLLGMTEENAKAYISLVDDPLNVNYHGNPRVNVALFERLKPGFARLNLPWFAPEEEIDYILDALELVADQGWKLVPQYNYNGDTGEWSHHASAVTVERKWLNDVPYYTGRQTRQEYQPVPWSQLLQDAKEVFGRAASLAKKAHVIDQRGLFTHEAAKLRWFILPYEAKQALLYADRSPIPHSRRIHCPFVPRQYAKHLKLVKGPAGEVGTLHGNFHISPFLQRLLQKGGPDKGRPLWLQKHNSSGSTGSNGTGRLWFQGQWLKSMMSPSKSNDKVDEILPCDDCHDEEAKMSQQYWTNAVKAIHGEEENTML